MSSSRVNLEYSMKQMRLMITLTEVIYLENFKLYTQEQEITDYVLNLMEWLGNFNSQFA